MESKIEDKSESLEKTDNEADNNTKIDSSQSDAFVSRVKLEDLRSTKSSPHRNLELHHTRSFSEIYHLHPSCSDISCMSPICPKPKAISDLQHEVRRPESVLQLSDLGAFSDSDDESEEDFMTTQQKGDEAMKIFLESNISVPLDGAMTSSSLSEDTLDSDIASESELIVGNWERGGRDLIASAGSSFEKRFLTPSGQLLYREHQVDSMLDTKRLKLTPSSSERPISPLAMRKNEENVKYKTSVGGSERATSRNEKGRRYKIESDSDSENQESDMNKEIPVDNTDGEKIQNTDCDCGLRLQDLKQVVHKYEVQCEELIDRSKEQYDEIKTLRKDNVNMHREHNRLQELVRECYQNENALKENMAAMSKERDQKVEKLKKTVQELENNLEQKASEIVTLQKTIDSHVEERAKYIKTIKEINTESKALLEALAKELGLEETIEINNEENAEAVVVLLKTRRHSLPDDFKNFPKNLNQATGSDVVNEIENHMKEDFREISAGYKDTITKMQKAEKGMGKILKRSASLEGFLKQRKGIYNSDDQRAHQFRKTELEGKLRELKRKNDSLLHENKMLQEECAKWKLRCDQILKQNEKNAPGKATVKLRKDKTTASEELKKLKRYLKERRRSYSETQLETLQNNFARPGNSKAETSSSTEKTANVKGFSDLEDRLKHLSQLTEDLSEKIERSNEHSGNETASSDSKKKQDASSNSGTKDCSDRMLFAFYGGKLFSVVKRMYNDHMSALQDNIHTREQEFRHLQEQLTVKEGNEEVTRCYVASLKRAIAISQDELRNCKNKNRDLKKELRALKDQVLVTNTEREMALFYCKKNGVVNGALVKHEDCSDTGSQPAQGNMENVYGTIEETSYFKKQIKRAGT